MNLLICALQEAAAAGDAEEENEEVDERSDKKPKKPHDPEKAFQNLTDVKKYDYLLGMSMWMLTDERKNELLKQRDNKLSELSILKAKTPESIWMADLEALEKKLDEVEEKERKEELGVNLKTSKQLAAKAAAASSGKRKRAVKGNINAEIYPASDGIKVEFKVTEEVLKKYEKMAVASARAKAKKEGGGDGADNGTGGGEIDEFDNLVNKKKPGKFYWFVLLKEPLANSTDF